MGLASCYAKHFLILSGFVPIRLTTAQNQYSLFPLIFPNCGAVRSFNGLRQKNRKLFSVPKKSSLMLFGVKSSIFIMILLYNLGFIKISECLTHLERFLISDFIIFPRVLKVVRILNLERRSVERAPRIRGTFIRAVGFLKCAAQIRPAARLFFKAKSAGRSKV